MSRLLKPHSPEWFEAMRRFDPKKAEMTRIVIAQTGRDDVCSICGDDPAKDYEVLTDQTVPSDAVMSLRLCDDCVRIRQASCDERFREMEG